MLFSIYNNLRKLLLVETAEKQALAIEVIKLRLPPAAIAHAVFGILDRHASRRQVGRGGEASHAVMLELLFRSRSSVRLGPVLAGGCAAERGGEDQGGDESHEISSH